MFWQKYIIVSYLHFAKLPVYNSIPRNNTASRARVRTKQGRRCGYWSVFAMLGKEIRLDCFAER